LKKELSEAIDSKHLLLLQDPGQDLNIERYLSRVRIQCFKRIMIETGNTTNIIGSLEVAVAATEFL
jgi:hypothetical protein